MDSSFAIDSPKDGLSAGKERISVKMEVMNARLRALEVRYESSNGAHSETGCPAATQVNETVELLGQEYNTLEERIHDLEVSDYKLKLRIAELEGKNSLRVGNTEYGSSLQSQLKEQQTTLDEVSNHLHLLENGPSYSTKTSSLSTHQLAEALIGRLNGGDTLGAMDSIRLQSAIGLISTLVSRGRLLETPVTNIPSRQSSDEELPLKRKRGRPSLSKVPSMQSSCSGPTLKRPPGRPPKRGKLSRKSSLSSSQSASEVSSENEQMEVNAAAIALAKASIPMSTTTPEAPVEVLEAIDSVLNRTPVTEEIRETQEHNQDMKVRMESPASHTFIPPERRSTRTPKRAQPFGDVVSWKEVRNFMCTKGSRLMMKCTLNLETLADYGKNLQANLRLQRTNPML